MKFKKNIGEIDKAARAVLGIVLLCVYVGAHGAQSWRYVVLALGLIMIATAAYGVCPLYTLFRMGTLSAKGKKKK